MDKRAKIYVAGHRGLVGSAIVRNLRARGYDNLLLRTHAELDLTDQGATEAFFAAEKPEYVFLAAAKVGGILANNTYPADFLSVNLQIQVNVMDAALERGPQLIERRDSDPVVVVAASDWNRLVKEYPTVADLILGFPGEADDLPKRKPARVFSKDSD